MTTTFEENDDKQRRDRSKCRSRFCYSVLKYWILQLIHFSSEFGSKYCILRDLKMINLKKHHGCKQIFCYLLGTAQTSDDTVAFWGKSTCLQLQQQSIGDVPPSRHERTIFNRKKMTCSMSWSGNMLINCSFWNVPVKMKSKRDYKKQTFFSMARNKWTGRVILHHLLGLMTSKHKETEGNLLLFLMSLPHVFTSHNSNPCQHNDHKVTTHSRKRAHTPRDNKHSRTPLWIKDMGTSWN